MTAKSEIKSIGTEIVLIAQDYSTKKWYKLGPQDVEISEAEALAPEPEVSRGGFRIPPRNSK